MCNVRHASLVMPLAIWVANCNLSHSDQRADACNVQADRDQSTTGAASGLRAHFKASVCSGSTRSQCRHLNSVRPFSARTAFVRFLQCEHRVVSMADLSLVPSTGPWNKSSVTELS